MLESFVRWFVTGNQTRRQPAKGAATAGASRSPRSSSRPAAAVPRPLEPLEPRLLFSAAMLGDEAISADAEFLLFADESLTTPGLAGTYVDQSLRAYAPHDDWRDSQTVAGVRIDETIRFTSRDWGNRGEVGLTGGTDDDWDNFSVQWDGWLEIVEPVSLATRSDDGSRMWIDVDRDGTFDSSGVEFINNNWGRSQGATTGPSCELLETGVYRIRIQYEDGDGGNVLLLLAAPPPAIHLYTEASLSAPGLVGSYVNQSLRSHAAHDDWRLTQTIAGTRVDESISFISNGWGSRAAVGLTNGSDDNWDYFSAQWDGWVDVARETSLATRSDDGSRMWIDLNGDDTFDSSGPEFIDNNWGGGQAATTGPRSVVLEPGQYRVRIQYDEGNGGNSMQLLALPAPMIRVAYVIPSNRTPQAYGVEVLQQTVLRTQAWYGDQMERNGFGPKTFLLETETDGVTPRIHVVHVSETDDYLREDSWNRVLTAASNAGVSLWSAGENWIIVPEIHILNPDGIGEGGMALGAGWASGLDGGVAMMASTGLAEMDFGGMTDNRAYDGLIVPGIGPYPLVQGVSLPWFEGTTISSVSSSWHGALVHELGHALGLPHDFRNDSNFRGNLMGNGLRGFRGAVHPDLYPDDYTYLSYGEALALNVSRFFNVGQYAPEENKPSLSILTAGSTGIVDGQLAVSFSASDDSGLAAAVLMRNGDLIGEMALSGTSVSETFTTPHYVAGQTDNFSVIVCDLYGNRRSADADITPQSGANAAPRPFVTVSSLTVSPGRPVTLDASRSSDPDHDVTVLTVEWDLDGDGVFDTAPSTDKVLVQVFPEEGSRLIHARLTDPAGAQSVSTPLPLRIVDLAPARIQVTDSSNVADDASIQFVTPVSQFRSGTEDPTLVRPACPDVGQYIDVTNSGGSALTLYEIQVTAPDVTLDIPLTADPAAAIVLVPGETQRFRLTYAPTSPTLDDATCQDFDLTDGLVILSDAANAPVFHVALEGHSTFNSDITYDGKVNLAELGPLNANFGKASGDSDWDPTADIDGDGAVNLAELGPLNREFGRELPSATSPGPGTSPETTIPTSRETAPTAIPTSLELPVIGAEASPEPILHETTTDEEAKVQAACVAAVSGSPVSEGNARDDRSIIAEDTAASLPAKEPEFAAVSSSTTTGTTETSFTPEAGYRAALAEDPAAVDSIAVMVDSLDYRSEFDSLVLEGADPAASPANGN